MAAFIRKYGVATANGTHINIPIVKAGEVNFAVSADWTPAAGDVKITKDDGTPGNIATLPTYIANHGWKFVFSAAELQCKKLDVLIVDQTATKVIEDQSFKVETYGHASAMMPIDFSDIVRMGLTALPNAASDAAGGLPTTLLNKALLATEVGIVGAGAHTVSSIAASDLTALTTGATRYGVINFTSGANKGRSAPITGYTTGTGAMTFDPAFPLPAVPSATDTFTVT